MRNNLALLLGSRKEKVSDLSKGTGLSRQTLSALYYEKSGGIQFDTLEKICNYFGCDVGDLLTVKGGE